MDILNLFEETNKRRNLQIKRLEMVKKDILYKTIENDTWSCEAILRHLLMGMGVIRNYLTDKKKGLPKFSLMTGKSLDKSITLKEIKDSLNEISTEVRELIISTSEDQWKNEVKNFLGKLLPLEIQVSNLLYHELEHIGEIKWIFKRLTSWDDKKMYSVM